MGVQLKKPDSKNKVELGKNEEAEYKEFQETVLTKKWLPIATPLLCESDKPKSILDRMSTEKSRTKSSKDSKGTKSSSKDRSKDSSKSSGHGTRKDTSVQSHLTANNFIAQI